MNRARLFVVPVAMAMVVAIFAAPAMAAPANDDFANGTALSGAHVTRLGDSSNGSTGEPGEPVHAGAPYGNTATIWYTWTPALPGPVTLTTGGSNFDTVLGVYTGSVLSTVTTITSNDDDPGTALLTSRVHFDAVAATTYHIAVGGYGGDTGSVNIHLYEGPVSTIRVSLTESGAQIPSCGGGGCGNSYNAAYDDVNNLGGNAVMSADGNTIVFANAANTVVAGDVGAFDDIFVRNVLAGTTTRASVDATNTSPNSFSYDPSVDTTGTKVVFTSEATDIVTPDGNGTGDVFMRNMTLIPPAAGALTRISSTAGGGAGNDWSEDPTVSSDGNVVAYESWATNLTTPAATGNRQQILVRNISGATTTMASVVSSTTTEGTGNGSFDPSLDADGSVVAFESDSTNLLGAGVDTNAVRDVFVHDMIANTTTRVSVDSTGLQVNGRSDNPSISADGTKVAFQSNATNLIATDSNGATDIFVRDLTAGTTTRVSVRANGIQSIQGKGASTDPVVSPDGRYVLFASTAPNLVAGDTNGVADIFLHDLVTRVTSRISVQTGGDQGTGASSFPAVSANGVVSWTYAGTDFAALDTNGRDDIYARTIGFQPDALIKAPLEATYSGDGIYQTSASGAQAKLIKAAKGSLSTFAIQVQNDGSVSDAFKVVGCAKKPGFKVTYTTGGSNVTSAVTTSTYVTSAIAPDDNLTLTLAVKLSLKAKGALVCPITVTSASDAAKIDQVQATVRALR